MLNLPLRAGPDIDWRRRCHPGDSQGETDACAMFAIVNWIECILDTPVDDDASIELWRAERQFRYRDLNGGLTVPEAFAAALIRTKLLPAGTSLRRLTNLAPLALAPLVVTLSGLEWAIPPGTSLLSKVNPETDHAVLAVADLAGNIWIENSHGPRWGKNGFGHMPHATFARHCTQIWQIVLPGSPVTLAQAARKDALTLAESIGTHVRSIDRNLQILGYSLPGNGRLLIMEIMRRSMLAELTAAQEKAKSNLADVYIMLQGGGITDDDINGVWEVVK